MFLTFNMKDWVHTTVTFSFLVHLVPNSVRLAPLIKCYTPLNRTLNTLIPCFSLWLVPTTPAKRENPRIIDRPPPPPSKNVLRGFFFFSPEILCWKLLAFPTSSRWTSCGMVWRPVGVVQQFSCSYPLKGSSDVFLCEGRPIPQICETAKYKPAKIKGWVYRFLADAMFLYFSPQKKLF